MGSCPITRNVGNNFVEKEIYAILEIDFLNFPPMRYSPNTIPPDVKPSFRRLVSKANTSFNVRVDSRENLRNTWHYHPEMELILMKRSAGTRIVGTNVETFGHNEVLLIGKNVPHAFFHEEKYLKANRCQPPQAVVIQFDETFMGHEFLNLPELRDIRHLFEIARRGLSLTGAGKKRVIPIMESMLDAPSLDRILMLLEIIRILVYKDMFRILMREGCLYQLKTEEDERIAAVIGFTQDHYDQNIKIEEVAEMAHLTRESFCRYFKTQTGKTYMEFLIEVRISKACKKLMENRESIKEIAYACGFDSLSNFHYQFKKIIKQSPLKYRSECQPQFRIINH